MFKKGLLRLNEGEANKSAYFYESKYSNRLELDNRRVMNERNEARSELQREKDDHSDDVRRLNKVADDLRKEMLEQNNKHLKTTLKLGAVTVGLAVTTWALGHFGIL